MVTFRFQPGYIQRRRICCVTDLRVGMTNMQATELGVPPYRLLARWDRVGANVGGKGHPDLLRYSRLKQGVPRGALRGLA